MCVSDYVNETSKHYIYIMKFILNLIPNIVRNMFVKQKPPPLGRWSVSKCSDIALLDSQRASEDHCGADLCGLPKPLNISSKTM